MTRKTRVYSWGVMYKLAAEHGLTLRFHNEKGISPRTFQLGKRGTTAESEVILANLSVADIEDDYKLSNGMTMKQTIMAHAIRSKK